MKCYVADEQFIVFCIPSHGSPEDEGVVAFQTSEVRVMTEASIVHNTTRRLTHRPTMCVCVSHTQCRRV